MRRRSLAILLGCGALTACAAAPHYQPPAVDVPAQWSQAGAGGAAPAGLGDPRLESLVTRALRANLDLRLADARLREVRARSRGDEAALAPAVGAGGSLAGERESRNTENPLEVASNGEVERPGRVQSVFQAGFDASWELDLFGRTERLAEAARADLDSAALDRDAVATSLIAEMARIYIELREAQQVERLDQAALDAARDAARLARVRFDAGMAAATDVLQAELAARRAETSLSSDAALSRTAILQLSLLLNEPAAALEKELAAPAPIPALQPLPVLGIPSDLLRQRPDIRSAERRVAAASARLDLAHIDFYPRISLGGSAGLASTAASAFFDPASAFFSAGPSFSWPIFDGGRISAEIEVRDAQLEQALIGYRKAILTGIQDVETALADCRRDKALLDQLAALAGQQQDAETLQRARYGGGLDDFRGSLAAESETLLARRERVRGEAALAIDLVALRKALGGWAGAPR
jgi:NodT family efflux transporter outer membrane factor (OMF) lipoprotein